MTLLSRLSHLVRSMESDLAAHLDSSGRPEIVKATSLLRGIRGAWLDLVAAIAPEGVAHKRFCMQGTQPAAVFSHPSGSIGCIKSEWLAVDGQLLMHLIAYDDDIIT